MLNLEDFKAFYKLPTTYHLNTLSALHILIDPKVPDQYPIPPQYFKTFKEKKRILQQLHQIESQLMNISRTQFLHAQVYLLQNSSKKQNSTEQKKEIIQLNDYLLELTQGNTSKVSTLHYSQDVQSTNEMICEDNQRSYRVKIIKDETKKFEVFKQIKQTQPKPQDFFTNLSFHKKLKSKKKKQNQLAYNKPKKPKNIFQYTDEDRIIPIIQESQKLKLVDFDEIEVEHSRRSLKSISSSVSQKSNRLNDNQKDNSFEKNKRKSYQNSNQQTLKIDLSQDTQILNQDDSPYIKRHLSKLQQHTQSAQDNFNKSDIITNISESSSDSSNNSTDQPNQKDKSFKLVFFDEYKQKVTSEKFDPNEFTEAIEYLNQQDFIEKGEVDIKKRLTRVSIRRSSLLTNLQALQQQQSGISEDSRRQSMVSKQQDSSRRTSMSQQIDNRILNDQSRRGSINQSLNQNNQTQNDQRRRSSLNQSLNQNNQIHTDQRRRSSLKSDISQFQEFNQSNQESTQLHTQNEQYQNNKPQIHVINEEEEDDEEQEQEKKQERDQQKTQKKEWGNLNEPNQQQPQQEDPQISDQNQYENNTSKQEQKYEQSQPTIKEQQVTYYEQPKIEEPALPQVYVQPRRKVYSSKIQEMHKKLELLMGAGPPAPPAKKNELEEPEKEQDLLEIQASRTIRTKSRKTTRVSTFNLNDDDFLRSKPSKTIFQK